MNKLTSPTTVQALLKKHNFRTSKRYGQNFIVDHNIVERIVDTAEITEEDIVLEVGPGIGTMTLALSERAAQVFAVEIDTHLIPILEETTAGRENITIHHGDILKTDVSALIGEGVPFKIVANLPYYITSPIIMGFLESDLPIQGMTYLIQKEVGDRLGAEPGTKEYGALTIACQYYAEVSVAFKVPPTVFIPRPRVDSAVLHLKKREVPPVEVASKEAFFKIVKASFMNRRKTLANGLQMNLGIPREITQTILESMGYPATLRGEKLSDMEFARLSNLLVEQKHLGSN
ncbi:MAG: 16S rRNA (adenine(1518)-N(6)/adenine(1519)-N(6))-dimethyltransferase RsmA [Eubacteriaceae bacterium]|nr:16S rRNA (adenine(1518)-N(6)/adenine(1519)-N(6))-dimethyltransferase RsmA [Eubacteriaceae bacterium]